MDTKINNKTSEFLYLFYFYLKRVFSLKNILFMIGLFFIFLPIYFVFKLLIVNTFEVNDMIAFFDKWMVFLIIFNFYISFILNYLYIDLKKSELITKKERKFQDTMSKIIIMGILWFIIFFVIINIFLISSSEYKYNSNFEKNNSYNRTFALLIFSIFFNLLTINIAGLLITKNSSFIYLAFIFILNCCILFWILIIISNKKSTYETFIKISELEIIVSFIIGILNICKRVYFPRIIFKKE